ncbi:hypothetical protein B7494_g337 [Chlorociboria aeruginascens]|nr:hypothetical protein B7494_g337 [Chlorociboria aeruginascens]
MKLPHLVSFRRGSSSKSIPQSKSQGEEIIDACKTGDLTNLKSLLTSPDHSSQPNPTTQEMLQTATAHNQPLIMRFFFTHNPHPSSLITRDIILASLTGGVEAFKVLREIKPNITHYSFGHAGDMLGHAIRKNDFEFVEFLLAKGVDPNKSLFLDKAAIEVAAAHSTKEIVRTLLAHGARVEGTNALLSAVWNSRPDVLRLLLEDGGEIDVDEVLNREGKFPEPVPKDVTVLQVAFEKRERECVRILVEHGADPMVEEGGDGKRENVKKLAESRFGQASEQLISNPTIESSYLRYILAFPQTKPFVLDIHPHNNLFTQPIRSTTMADHTDYDVTYHQNNSREDQEELKRRGESSQQRRSTGQKEAKKMADKMGSSAQDKRRKNKEEIAEREKAEKEKNRDASQILSKGTREQNLY